MQKHGEAKARNMIFNASLTAKINLRFLEGQEKGWWRRRESNATVKALIILYLF